MKVCGDELIYIKYILQFVFQIRHLNTRLAHFRLCQKQL